MKQSLRQFAALWIFTIALSTGLFTYFILKNFVAEQINTSSLKDLRYESYLVKEKFKKSVRDLENTVATHLTSKSFVKYLADKELEELRQLILNWKNIDKAKIIYIYDIDGKFVMSSDDNVMDSGVEKELFEKLKSGYGQVTHHLNKKGISITVQRRVVNQEQQPIAYFFEKKDILYKNLFNNLEERGFVFANKNKVVKAKGLDKATAQKVHLKANLEAFELSLPQKGVFDVFKVNLFKNGFLYLVKKNLRTKLFSNFYDEYLKYYILFFLCLLIIFYLSYYRKIYTPLRKMSRHILESKKEPLHEEFSIKEINQIAGLLRGKVSDLKKDLVKNKEHHDQSVNRLVASVAHELNNSLSYVGSNISYINDEIKDLKNVDPDDIQEALDSAKLGYERIRRIVSDLKVFSAKNEISIKSVETKDLSSWVSGNFKNVIVSNECLSSVKVLVDQGRFQQIIKNLIDNALDAYEDGAAEKFVKVSFYELDQSSIMVDVIDQASGIPIGIQSQIFSPFYTTKKNKGGTGLGLSLSANLAKEMKASLHLKDSSSAGSIFCLNLRRV